MKIFSRTLTSVLLCGTAAFPALATNGVYYDGVGARSTAMGGTGYAYDAGATIMVMNPAMMAYDKGAMAEVSLTLAGPSPLKITNLRTGATVEDTLKDGISDPYIGGNVSYRTQLDDTIAIGGGVFTMGGFGANFGRSSYISLLPSGVDTGVRIGSRAAVIRAPLAMSYRVSPQLSIGGAFDVVYQGISVQALYGIDQVGDLAANGRAFGSLVPGLVPFLGTGGAAYLDFAKPSDIEHGVRGVGISGRLGAAYDLDDNTRLGLAVQLPGKMGDLKGRGNAVAFSPTGMRLALRGQYKIKDLDLPPELGIGIYHKVGAFAITGEYRRIWWSDGYSDLKIRFKADNNGGDLGVDIPTGLVDVDQFNVGVSYDVMENLTLRMGGRFSEKVLNPPDSTPLIPTVVSRHLGFGMTWTAKDNLTLDVGYSMGFNGSLENRSRPNTGTAAPTKVRAGTQNLSAAATYHF
jgi:long-chain fatty acid transport protein